MQQTLISQDKYPVVALPDPMQGSRVGIWQWELNPINLTIWRKTQTPWRSKTVVRQPPPVPPPSTLRLAALHSTPRSMIFISPEPIAHAAQQLNRWLGFHATAVILVRGS